MEVAEPGSYLESLDLKLKWEIGKITVDVHSKPINNFMNVLPTLSQEKCNQHST